MLNGIEILNTIELTNTVKNQLFCNISLTIGIAIILSLSLGMMLAIFENYGMIIPLSMGITLVPFFVVSILVRDSMTHEVPNGKYEYQVTISDNVSMTEFNEKYDVISVEGKIWTIIEKEEE